MSHDTTISIALYDAESGERIRNVGSINMNTANPGEFTKPVAIRMFANNAKKIKNVSLAIVDSSDPIAGSGTPNADGSVPVGNAGIEHGKNFEVKTALASFFPGKNATGLSISGNSVSIENVTETSTEFVYLNVKVPEETGGKYIKYKWFFDIA